jgi:hypothetical protein
MRRLIFVTILAMTAAVAATSAQTKTADGVAALLRGDYQRAVEILKPVAEDDHSRDTIAQFFMAGLYQSGQGVPADPLRACALYVRAASNAESPFGQEASNLFVPSISRGPDFQQDCMTLANVGFNSGFEPVTFDLGPGHFVEWKLSAATVTYDSRIKRAEMPFSDGAGARFLPLRYTRLDTGATRMQPRHFVEAFVWQPPVKTGPWTLRWYVFEVVRDEIITIEVSEAVTTAQGDAPPSPASFDPREYGQLRVNDDGDAELAILKGPHQTTRRIETDAERHEARATAAARDAELKAVDWKAKHEVSRQPAMNYTGAEGCGNFEIYGWSSDRAEAVVVGVNASTLNLSTRPATFDLSRETASISVNVHVYDRAQQRFEFCTDVGRVYGPGSIEPEVWSAVAGTITIEPSTAAAHAARRTTITLSNITVRNSAGGTVRITRPVKLTATIGAVFG